MIPLTQEIMFPVCTPADLAYAERSFWTEWLRAAGLPQSLARRGPRSSDTALALAAAEAGGGLVMAQRVPVMDALAAGRLVRPLEPSIADGLGFHLVVAADVLRRTTVRAFADWIRAELKPAG